MPKINSIKKKDFYRNYYSTHYVGVHSDMEAKRKNSSRELDQSLSDIFDSKSKDINILDLGCGFGSFSYFCKKKGFKNYLGIDISEEEIEICKKDFPEFEFFCEDVFNFLKRTKKKFDLIFMSHFLEHFTLEEGKNLLELANKRLNNEGIIINIMPNAGAYFHSAHARYADITHEIIYSPQSFSQLLRNLGFNEFEHRNWYMGNNMFKHYLHKLALLVFEYFIRLLGYSKHDIYTHSMITIIKKKL